MDGFGLAWLGLASVLFVLVCVGVFLVCFGVFKCVLVCLGVFWCVWGVVFEDLFEAAFPVKQRNPPTVRSEKNRAMTPPPDPHLTYKYIY